MLVLTRKYNQRVLLVIPEGFSGEILINVADIDLPPAGKGKSEAKIKLGVVAPREVEIHREEMVRLPVDIQLKAGGIAVGRH